MPAHLAALFRPHSARERFALVQREDGWRLLLLVDKRTRDDHPVSSDAAEAMLRSQMREPMEEPNDRGRSD